MQLDHEQMPETALAWHRAGRGAVLATVIETWGSAPRPVGGQLVISGDAELAGSVSGGCVEGAVVAEAIDALDDGKARVLEYGVSDDEAFAVGLACGGRIRVMVEPVGAAMPEDMLADLVDARAERRPVAYRVATDTWDRSLLSRDDDRVADRFRMDRSGVEEDGATFVAVHNPPLRMVIVGAVHIAQPLVAMARLSGYDPTLVDPRNLPMDTNIAREIEQRDEVNQVKRLIGRLPEQQKRVILLRDVNDCSFEEIEQATGLNAINIRVLLSRARKKIREQYNAIMNYESK